MSFNFLSMIERYILLLVLLLVINLVKESAGYNKIDTEINSHHLSYNPRDFDILHRYRQQQITKIKSDGNQNQQVKNITQNQSEISRTLEAYEADDETRYVELVIVVDNAMYQAKGRNMCLIHSEMVSIVNILNAVYFVPLNIYIALVDVVVWSKTDEIDMNYANSISVLSLFLKYTQEKLSIEKPNDIAMLITGKKFDDSAVLGRAHINGMCISGSSGGLVKLHFEDLGLVASTIAHEIGHTLGMSHDKGKYCKCRGKACTMSAYNYGDRFEGWSTCSIQFLREFFHEGRDSCLHNKPKALFQSPTCGNGFIEPGEQCDCGIVRNDGDGEINPCHACCDPDTCMLRGNATCSSGACCDISACRLKPVGTQCRAVIADCDLPEYCSGYSNFCPTDVFKQGAMPPCGVKDQVTPISYEVPNGMYPGRVLRIDAITKRNADRFAVNLQCGPSTNRSDDIALQLYVLLYKKTVLRNHFFISTDKGTKKWGKEEREKNVPMAREEPFKIVITCEENAFKININDKNIAEFKHRIPYKRITHLNFEEDITVMSVKLTDTT